MTTDKKHNLIASDRIEGTPVKRSNGKKIGKIERLMLDKLSGQVAYAILSFGGILGIGDKHLPVPWAKLTYNPDREAYQLDLSDDELKNAPSSYAHSEFDWGDRSEELKVHNYYGISPYWGTYG